MDIKTCAYLLSQAVHLDHNEPHIFEEYSAQKPYEYARNAADVPLGMGFMGRYSAAYVPLVDGDMGLFRVTQDGKLMVDASVSVTSESGWTHKDYHELTVDDAGIALSVEEGGVPFIGKEFMIFNDGSEDLYYEFGAAIVIGSSPKMLGGEALVDNYASGDIHLICAAGKTTDVRIWIRG